MGSLSETVIQKIVGGRDVDWQLSVPIEAAWVRGNQALLEDALQSLVENACEATEGRGTIWVCVAKPDAEKVEVRVIDNGPGIPSVIRDRIFELGFSTKSNFERERGRGLFTCKAIIQKHRGKVTLDLRSDQDTAFVITLPTGGQAEDLDELPR